MKHFLKFSIVLLLCVFSSCNKGDDDGGDNDMSNEELIVGTWGIDSRTVNGIQDQFDECEALFTVTFASDLSFRSNERSGEDCSTSTQSTGTYTLNDTSLSVVFGQTVIDGEIITLTEDLLSIRFTVDETVVENYSR